MCQEAAGSPVPDGYLFDGATTDLDFGAKFQVGDAEDMALPKIGASQMGLAPFQMGVSDADMNEMLANINAEREQLAEATLHQSLLTTNEEGIVTSVATPYSLSLTSVVPVGVLMQCELSRSKGLFGSASMTMRVGKGEVLMSSNSSSIAIHEPGAKPIPLSKVETKVSSMEFELCSAGCKQADIVFEPRLRPDDVRPMRMRVTLPMRQTVEGQNKQPIVLQTVDARQSDGRPSLNFRGRVKLSSIKNMQLHIVGEEEVVLQMGRCTKDGFICDFRHPLTPVQAFGICIAVFENGGKA